MMSFQNAADKLKIEYQGFLDYLEGNEVKLSQNTENIGKNDCFALNQDFHIIRERYQKIGRTQAYYTVIDFFCFFSIRSGILQITKKKSLGLTFKRSQRYDIFSKMSSMEQYILMMAVWIGEYQEALNEPYSVFGNYDLFELMKETNKENILSDGFNRRRTEFWGRSYIPEIRLFGLFHLIRVDWLDEKDEDKDNKFRIKELYQTSEGCQIKRLIKKSGEDISFNVDVEFVLSIIKNIVDNSENTYKKLLEFWSEPKDEEFKTIDLKIMVGSCIRNIKIGSQFTLDDLHFFIQNSVDFDMDHLYYFQIGSGTSKRRYFDPRCDDDWHADSVTLAYLNLYQGMQFEYLFDFGDEWRFQIEVEAILDEHIEECEIRKTKGRNPQQYRY